MTGPQISDLHTRETEIDGLLVFEMKQVTDDRGTVREFFRESGYPDLGAWKQINITESHHGAIRGLHGESMTKLVACVSGAAYGAYLDARPDSTTYGKVVTVNLTEGIQVLVPAGVCNGFQAVKEGTQYLYCFTDEWRPGMAGTAFNPLDDGLNISWPLPVDVTDPAQVSAKDAGAPKFSERAGQ